MKMQCGYNIDNEGLQTIRGSIDNAAVLIYVAGHEPRARRYLTYRTLEYRTYNTHIVESLFDDGPFRTVPGEIWVYSL